MNATPHPTRHDLPATVRAGMVDLLNRQLADALDLALQAKQAHWNVKGPYFISLHGLFDTVAEELEEFTDSIAERAVALGGVALGTAQCIATHSRLPPYPLTAVAGGQHLAALADALGRFGSSTRAAINAAAQAGDAGTADLFTGVSRSVDKLLWMLEAHTHSRESIS